MIKKTGNKCVECSGEMYEIQIIDVANMNLHFNLKYSTDAFKEKPRRYKIAGRVAAEACEQCGRVALRVVPG